MELDENKQKNNENFETKEVKQLAEKEIAPDSKAEGIEAQDSQKPFTLTELFEQPSKDQAHNEASRRSDIEETIREHKERGGKPRQEENFEWDIDSSTQTARTDLATDRLEKQSFNDQQSASVAIDQLEELVELCVSIEKEQLQLDSKEFREFESSEIDEAYEGLGIGKAITERWRETPEWKDADTIKLNEAVAAEDWKSVNEIAANASFNETAGRHAFYNHGNVNEKAVAWAAHQSDFFTLEQTAAGSAFDAALKKFWDHPEK